MKSLLTVAFGLFYLVAHSQIGDLPFGKVTYADMDMKAYSKDSTAGAVVLNEIGKAYIRDEDNYLVFEHYLKIKILNRRGFDQANFSLRLQKSEKTKESLVSVVASTYNAVNGSMRETKMDSKNVFTEDNGKYSNYVKFTLPDIREGSVIEIKYLLLSPFIFTYRSWQFQSDIPKVHTEYSASIPGNFVYNITKRGYLAFKNTSSVVKDCYRPGAISADCARYEFAMEDVPAFVEEEYMTARTNFASAIYFELAEYHRVNGGVEKITKEWKDADQELKQHDDFGGQLRKAKGVLEDKIETLVKGETSELGKARAIYDFIKSWYVWNDHYGMLADLGVKQAFATRAGNAADINLSLVAALQIAGLNSSPVILSTRENGLPIEVHPVISDFNYVIASLSIGETVYLLDATDRYQPFGLIPMRCINGKGRLMAKESSWIELKGRDKQKTVFIADLIQIAEGYEGTFTVNYSGYDALKKRGEIRAAGEQAEYVRRLKHVWKEIEVLTYHVKNLDSLESPLEEKMTVRMTSGQPNASTVFFSPFLSERLESNPFKSNERLYPVDFGAPREQVLIVSLRYLPAYVVDELPALSALNLPQGGGRYLFNIAHVGQVVSVTSNLTLNKPVYNAQEYHTLKELFARMVAIQQSQIVFKKK